MIIWRARRDSSSRPLVRRRIAARSDTRIYNVNTRRYTLLMADREFTHRGTTFRWDELKAEQNLQKHGIAFEEAATVFDDPLLVVEDASRNEEQRDAVIGFSSNGRLLTVVHIEVGYE